MNKDFKLGSVVIMKKDHPCKTNLFKVVRTGIDIKIECINCKRVILLPRTEFIRKLKKVVEL